MAGVDADATATVTFSDGVNPDVVVSGLGNSATTVRLEARWPTGRSRRRSVRTTRPANSASGTGDSSTKDTTADADTNLAVTIDDSNGFVDNSEQGAVSYTVAGVDADAARDGDVLRQRRSRWWSAGSATARPRLT